MNHKNNIDIMVMNHKNNIDITVMNHYNNIDIMVMNHKHNIDIMVMKNNLNRDETVIHDNHNSRYIMFLFYLFGHNSPVLAFLVNRSFINKKVVFVIQFPLLLCVS